jgi:hypothetical protein
MAGAFGKRNSVQFQAAERTQLRAHGQISGLRPDAVNQKSGKWDLPILLVLAITAVAGLGAHRLYLKNYRAASVMFLSVVGMMSISITFMMKGDDTIGRLSFAIAWLFILLGIIDCYIVVLRKSFAIIFSQRKMSAT